MTPELIPYTMTGPEMMNILAAVPRIMPSACVKIGTREIFALFYWVFGPQISKKSAFFAKLL